MDRMFDKLSQYIKVFVGKETELDPYEKNVETTLLTPIPIKAIVTDLSNSKVIWSMPGIEVDKAKEIIIKKIHKDKLEMSQKFYIDGDEYIGWRINGRFQYRKEGNFLRCYVYIKKV